ncbi:hypothetical protein KFK09_026165 [Dendrobium nobile]|uniref:RecA family profile 1 domain-containing protein n=2 Tax=Dendrobium TaxID=37818 RepID=A0A8T3A735_DENNO|nr:hypothetical protein KFK09_026165 [Dendrobium nobile]
MQRSCYRLPSIPNMQPFSKFLFLESISLLKESQLVHTSPFPSFATAKKFSSAFRTIVSYYDLRGFHSSEQMPEGEEGDAAARVWALHEPISEQIMAKPKGGEVEEVDHPGADKSLQKGKLEMILRKAEGSGEEDEKTELLTRERYRWSSRAGGRVNEKKTKMKSSWVCKECGVNLGQWWGTCPSCKTPGSVKRHAEAKFLKSGAESVLDNEAVKLTVPQRLADVNKGMNKSDWRIPLNGHLGMEVARVLGGGIVPGSLVLFGGDPGVGKSTLLLQLAAIISEGCNSRGPARVVYVSGEESIEQIGNRADRMRITSEDLYLYSSTDVEDILDKVQNLSPKTLIVDSIQTVYLRDVIGSAGNITQVKECTLKLLHFAKETNIPVLLIGHVTKTGDIAGPRMLEHMVDAVLYIEGERYSSYRLLRSVKNRFGSTDELGLLEMTESGLQAVSNPNEMFLSENYSDSDVLAGLALAIVVDGSRTFVIEIQALCVSGSSVARHVNGIQESRADMIISVLMKQAGLKLQDNAIFLNVVSGFKLTETAGDLAIAAAICSSFLEFPIPHDVTFIGEVGLGGELRMVPRMDKRVTAAAKLGFKRCIVPKAAENNLSSLDLNIKILGCRTLKDVINTVFSTH